MDKHSRKSPPNQLRRARPADAAAIDRIHRAAFETDAEARLVTLLIDRGRAVVSQVAEEADQVVGHILFSPATIASSGAKHPPGLGLAPVAVLPQFQNRGIGAALIEAGLDECRRLGAAWVVVVGHPPYYPRFGFAPASRWNLTCDYTSGDAFQFLPLNPEAGAIRGGHVSYAPEFGEVFAE
jgi:putative acetyltransferase